MLQFERKLQKYFRIGIAIFKIFFWGGYTAGNHVARAAVKLLYTALYNPQEYTTHTLTFDPKILEKMDFGYIDCTSNSAF